MVRKRGTIKLVGTTPQWLKCMKCAHIWVGIYTPIELARYARLMAKAFCPKCGATANDLTLAKQNNGKLLESLPQEQT